MGVTALIAMMLSGVAAESEPRTAAKATPGCGGFTLMAYRQNPNRGPAVWQPATPSSRKTERRRTIPCFRLTAQNND